MRHALIRPALLGVAAAAAVPVFASAASAAPATASRPAAGAFGSGVTPVYVAPAGRAGAAGQSCASAAYASIHTISADYYGIFTAGGPVTVRGAQHNRFQGVTSPFGSSPTFS
jgi:hypothetical protein